MTCRSTTMWWIAVEWASKFRHHWLQLNLKNLIRSCPTGPSIYCRRGMLRFHSLCLGGLSRFAIPFRGTGGKECLTSLVCFLLWRDATNRVPALSRLATNHWSLPFNHQSMRRSPGTRSKCRSRLNTGRECWRQRAAIQTSLEGIGVPARLSSPRTAA